MSLAVVLGGVQHNMRIFLSSFHVNLVGAKTEVEMRFVRAKLQVDDFSGRTNSFHFNHDN